MTHQVRVSLDVGTLKLSTLEVILSFRGHIDLSVSIPEEECHGYLYS